MLWKFSSVSLIIIKVTLQKYSSLNLIPVLELKKILYNILETLKGAFPSIKSGSLSYWFCVLQF